MHALDFLDMDYKSPETLLTLLSPELLEKYKRVFAFLLKLLRGLLVYPNNTWMLTYIFPSRHRVQNALSFHPQYEFEFF